MKTTSLALLLVGLAAIAPAATLTFLWDDPNGSGSAYEYRLYERVGTNTVRLATTTNLSVTVPQIPPGPHSFFVTAVNGSGLESDPSETVSTNLLFAPRNLRVVLEVTVTVSVP